MNFFVYRFRPAMSVLVTLLALAVLGPSANLQAQKKGYNVEYLDTWPMTNQMRYIKVRITPVAGKSTEDLDFYTVASSRTYQNTGVLASTVISIRKGDTSASGEIYIPSFGFNHTIHTEVDGNLKHNRGDFARRNYHTDYYGNQANSHLGPTPTFVLASSEIAVDDSVQYTALSPMIPGSMATYNQLSTESEFPQLSDLDAWYVGTTTNGNRNPARINGFSSTLATAMTLESLPSKWFAYEGLGMLMLTFEDLKILSQKHPGKLLAIERWVASSGRLVVLNCGDNFQNADESLRLLGDSKSDVRDNRTTTFAAGEISGDEIDAALDEFEKERKSNVGNYYYRQARMSMAFDGYNLRTETDEDTLKNVIETDNGGSFVSVEFGLGQIVFVTDEASDWRKEKGQNIDRWGSFGIFLNDTNRRKNVDHSVLVGNTARRFGFPEFDEPPRYVFEFSILAYLLAIGPLTFFLLKRKHKLNLMFVIVPIISALFCTSILGYAIFAEGFDTRVNLFTVTSLDQRSGRQSTSSIAHVYSGMTPSAYGLTGPAYGFVNATDGGRSQRVRWNDSGEQVSGGEIRARTNHQFYTRSSSETESRLVFVIQDAGSSESATVRNDFETPVLAVAFRSDSCGKDEAWFCERIDAGETAEARKMSLDDTAAAMRQLLQEKMSATVYASGKTYGDRQNRSAVGDAATLKVVLELDKAWRMAAGDIRAQTQQENNRGFLAITEKASDYEVPIANAKLETEVHVVKGIR